MRNLSRRYFFKVISSNHGNMLVSILALTTFMSASLYGISQIVSIQSSQAIKNAKGADAQFALSAFLDYAVQGVKQTWCFSETMSRDQKCDLTHSRSIERLIMSNQALATLTELSKTGVPMGPLPPLNQLQLQQFEMTFSFSQLSTVHPLFPLTTNLGAVYGLKGAYVKIVRENNVLLPRTGNEVYVTVFVEMIGSDGARPAKDNGKLLRASSRLIIYQRELNSFALIVPRSLRLDLPGGSGSFSKGDVVVPSSSANEAKTWPGITFKSPVFINQDLYLPEKGYTPVTFSERVFLGQGIVRKGTKPFTPSGTGGEDSRWQSQRSSFGGLFAGISIDGKLDAGLRVGWWGEGSIKADVSLAKLCLDRNQFLSKTELISKSELYGVLSKQEDNAAAKMKSFTYLFNWTGQADPAEVNNFLGQDMPDSWKWDFSGWTDKAIMPTDQTATTKKGQTAFARVTVHYGDQKARINLMRQETASLKPDLAGRMNQLVKDAEIKVKEAERTVKSATEKAENAQKDHDTAKADAESADLLPELKAKLEKALEELKAAETILQIKKSLLEAQEALQASFVKEPPEIILTTAPAFVAGYDKPQPNLLNLTVAFKNMGGLIDSKGTQVPISVSVRGFDGTYRNTGPLVNIPNAMNQQERYLNFGVPAKPGGLKEPGKTAFSALDNPSDPKTTIPRFSYPGSWGKLEQDCTDLSGAQGSQAFGGASWAIDFSPQTRQAWNFKGADTGEVINSDPVLNSQIFDDKASSKAFSQWLVRSIVGTCTIRSSATLVTGFFACDKLVIENRSLPLEIIGTFIVGSLSVSEGALKAGINWSSIYATEAVPILRAAKTLRPIDLTGTAKCSDVPDPNDPIWNPFPSAKSESDRLRCNPISLRDTANPFQWTAVDPDCGLPPGASNRSCRNRPLNFFVVEYSREIEQ